MAEGFGGVGIGHEKPLAAAAAAAAAAEVLAELRAGGSTGRRWDDTPVLCCDPV